MRNIGPDEAQAGIKIAGRNINNLRYVDGTTLMQELKSLLMKVEEENENLALSSTFRKLRSWHLVPSLPANRWGNSERFYFGGAPKSLKMVTTAMKLKDAYSLEEKLWPT